MTTWVLLRGLTREACHWGHFPSMFGAVLPGSAILTPDLPGSGRYHALPSPTRVAAMVDWLRAELQAGDAPQPYGLLGLSLGGMVAVEWAARHPWEISACVLINTSLRPSPMYQRLRPPQYPRLLRLALLPDSAEVRESMILAMTSRLTTDRAALVAEWSAIRRRHPVSRRNTLCQLLAAARYQAPPRTPGLPMLVLAGARDALVDPACSSRLAQSWGLPLAVHPTAGHDLPLDDPEWVTGQVSAWLSRTGAGLAPPP